jgi:hypothetical protein
MKTAAHWLRGALAGSILAVTALGEPAGNVSFAAQSEPVLLATSLNPVVPRIEAVEAEAPTPAAPVAAALPVDPFPGHTYGNLEDVACLVALENRSIAYERYGRHAHGVQTPVRLMGPLHGVHFMHAEAPDWLQSARHEILDCRLVLALDDFAALLAQRGITAVYHYGVYRGDLPLPKKGRPLHHVAALAMDVAMFEKEDGSRLVVRRDWSRRQGVRPCAVNPATEAAAAPGSANAPNAPTTPARELRGILCDVVGEKLFHQVLTPNHDANHWDHFHLEVMRDTEWTLVE